MFQNTTKPRGRPRGFDEQQALDKAIHVFWWKGYDGVTIDDLVAGMGVGRPSLYAVFGDKRTLFLRVLRSYAETKGARAAAALLTPHSLRDSIGGLLKYIVESATEEGSAPGCLLGCIAPLVDDAEVRRFLQDAADATVVVLERRFRDGISAGDVPADFPVAARATQVLDLVRGLSIRALLGTPRETLLKDAEGAADLVLLPRRGKAARLRRAWCRSWSTTARGSGRVSRLPNTAPSTCLGCGRRIVWRGRMRGRSPPKCMPDSRPCGPPCR